MAEEEIVRRRPRDHGHELLQDAVLLAKRERVRRRRVETVEADDHVDPVVSRRQRHLDKGDDAVRAIGVHGLVQVLAGQFERARLGFHRHDAQSQDIAEIA